MTVIGTTRDAAPTVPVVEFELPRVVVGAS